MLKLTNYSLLFRLSKELYLFGSCERTPLLVFRRSSARKNILKRKSSATIDWKIHYTYREQKYYTKSLEKTDIHNVFLNIFFFYFSLNIFNKNRAIKFVSVNVCALFSVMYVMYFKHGQWSNVHYNYPLLFSSFMR